MTKLTSKLLYFGWYCINKEIDELLDMLEQVC